MNCYKEREIVDTQGTHLHPNPRASCVSDSSRTTNRRTKRLYPTVEKQDDIAITLRVPTMAHDIYLLVLA